MSPDDLKNFQEWGAPLPTRDAHGTPEEIRSNLKSGNPRNWKLHGNRLVAETDFGELSQTIPTDYILTGTDERGLPILKKI